MKKKYLLLIVLFSFLYGCRNKDNTKNADFSYSNTLTTNINKDCGIIVSMEAKP